MNNLEIHGIHALYFSIKAGIRQVSAATGIKTNYVPSEDSDRDAGIQKLM